MVADVRLQAQDQTLLQSHLAAPATHQSRTAQLTPSPMLILRLNVQRHLKLHTLT